MDNYTKQKLLGTIYDLRILQPEIKEHQFFVDLMNQSIEGLKYIVESAFDPDFDADDEDNFKD